MEETLKLILEKISSVDKEINNIKNNMATKEDINSINTIALLKENDNLYLYNSSEVYYI